MNNMKLYDSEALREVAVIFFLSNFFFVLLMTSSISTATGQNYDESQVPRYELPDPLIFSNGKNVDSPAAWWAKRRGEILQLFEDQVYGRSPEELPKSTITVTEEKRGALDGLANRKQVTVRFGDGESGPALNLLVYLPLNSSGPVPLFVGLNFMGNQTVHPDPEIAITTSWTHGGVEEGIVDHYAQKESRGVKASRWPIEKILARGYGVATAHCGDLDPDFDDGFSNGIQPLFFRPGQTKPKANQWQTIGAWSWGLSRAMDYFETEEQIDATRIVVLGHSRLGKTALWAGAQDPRFAVVISNNSGCGGAALSRRRFGETVAAINKSFPHWFCGNFKKYDNKEQALPVDQHMLIALIAPRPVYIASAAEDRWADPKGEFLAALGADPVYRLLGTEGLPVATMPQKDFPVQGTIGYHVRSGRHDITGYDWDRYLDFSDRHLQKSTPP
jgi:hypothetical protein